MPDASLTFAVDSSQAQRAIAILEALKASSITVTQASGGLTTATNTVGQAYDQQRDKLTRLVESTKAYDGTLQGLIGRLDQLRNGMSTSQQALAQYSQTLTQAASAATSFNQTIDGLDRYVSKARELRTTTADLATGLERITAALKNQTTEGVAAREALAQIGISVQGISSARPDQVLQRLAEQIRSVRMTQGTVQGFQQILGQSFDAQALTALGAQPYTTDYQRRQVDRSAGAAGQIDAQQQQITRLNTELTRNAARLADISTQFSQGTGFFSRAGLNPFVGGVFQSQDQQRRALEAIAAGPDAESHRTFASRIGRAIEFSGPANAVRNFTSGTFSSNQDEIAARGAQEAAATGYGGAFLRGQGRELANLVGLYTPTLQRDPRDITEGERLRLRQESGGILAGFGDTSLAGINRAEDVRRQFNNADTQTRYRQAFGADGDRRFANQGATVGQGIRYAEAPEQQIADQTQMDALLLGLPPEQRAQAQAAIQFQRGIIGDANVRFAPGTGLGGILGNARLGAGAQQVQGAAWQQQIAGVSQQNTEQNDQQIRFQAGLADAVNKGRAAAEDYTRAESARHDMMIRTGDATLAEKAAQEAHNVTIAQRITQGASLNDAAERQNRDLQEQLDLTNKLNLAGASDVTRLRAQQQLAITQQVRGDVTGGTQPGEETPRQRFERERDAAALADAQRLQTGKAAAGSETALRGQINDAGDLVRIMHEQNATSEQAQKILEDQKTIQAAIVNANEQDKTVLEGKLTTMQELRREQNLLNNDLRNQDQLRTSTVDVEFERSLIGLPASEQAYRRATKATVTGGIVASQAGDAPLAPAGPRVVPVVPQGGWSNDPRAAPYAGMIRTSAASTGLGADLLTTLLGLESTFNPNAKNPGSTASGLGQQIRGNAYLHGGSPLDPGTSIQAAAEEFAARLRRSGGNIEVAAQGYGTLANLPPAERAAKLAALVQAAGGASVTMPGQTPGEVDTQTQLIGSQRSGVRVGFEQQDAASQRRFQQQQQLQAQRDALIAQGRTGEAARIIGLDDTTDADLAQRERARRTAAVVGGQRSGQIAAGAQTSQQISDTAREVEALNQGYGKSAAALRDVDIQLEVDREVRERGEDVVNRQARSMQLYIAQLEASKKALAESNIEQEKAQAGQSALNARGPFSDQLDQAATRRRVATQQYFQDHPDMVGTPEGNQRVQNDAAQDAIDQQTRSMGELREAASGAEQAIEGTMTNIIVNGERGREALRSMGAEFEKIILNTVVFKPFEHALSSLFTPDNGPGGGGGGNGGGGASGGDAATGSTPGGGGSMSEIGGALSSFAKLVNSGGGSGGGGSPAVPRDTTDTTGSDSGTQLTFAGTTDSTIGDNTRTGGDSTGTGAEDNGPLGSFGTLGQKFLQGQGVSQQLDKMLGTDSNGGMFSHAGGLTGFLVDKVGGQGFYKGGGLIGSWLGGSGNSDIKQPGDTTFGGTGGSGDASDTGFVTPPIPPPDPGALGDAATGASATSDLSAAFDDGATALVPSALGNVFRGGRGRGNIADFENQVITAPTFFRFARGAGLMGEAGPEAVMPLTRGPNGKLGVSATGGGGAVPNVVFNIHTPDANSFRATQSQLHSRATAVLQRNQGRSG